MNDFVDLEASASDVSEPEKGTKKRGRKGKGQAWSAREMSQLFAILKSSWFFKEQREKQGITIMDARLKAAEVLREWAKDENSMGSDMPVRSDLAVVEFLKDIFTESIKVEKRFVLPSGGGASCVDDVIAHLKDKCKYSDEQIEKVIQGPLDEGSRFALLTSEYYRHRLTHDCGNLSNPATLSELGITSNFGKTNLHVSLLRYPKLREVVKEMFVVCECVSSDSDSDPAPPPKRTRVSNASVVAELTRVIEQSNERQIVVLNRILEALTKK